MSEAFDKAFNWIISAEGGYVNDPHDPGGETKYGISKRAYPFVDIPNLTLDQAKDIYQKTWDSIHGDELPYPLNTLVFDCAVNQGRGAAVQALQRVLGVDVDGMVGPETVKAAQATQATILVDYLTYRALLYSALPGFKEYGKGWFNRLFRLSRSV
jgi:lysozyme family protein